MNLPFQLIIKRISEKRTETLTCTALLREIADNREVYDGRWGDKNVIAKVFANNLAAKRRIKRELRGLNQLQALGLNAPKLLFCGRTNDDRWAIVEEKITASSTFLEAFSNTENQAEILSLSKSICKELARQHSKGVIQKDLHLGNFLIQKEKIFAIDANRMRFLPHPVTRKKSLSRLAVLACCLPDKNPEILKIVLEEYARTRGWQINKDDEEFLQKKLLICTKKAVKQTLKKYLRTSKRCLRIKTANYVAVIDKNFCAKTELLDLIKQIDTLMNAGRILKNGNTCYVSCTSWNNKDIVIKRYNHKGLIHSLRHTVKGSRAKRCWLNGHRLLMLGTATPKPLAYIEQRKGLLVWKSYLVTEYVQGQRLCDFLRDKTVAEKQHLKVTQQISELLDKLGKHRITHGDLKHTNILITEKGPILTDLDGMHKHRFDWTCKLQKKKDISHLNG